MIISPPFLPADGLTSENQARIDPMMDLVDQYELGHHGVYPIAFDRRWHCGVHLAAPFQNEPVRAIADGEVVAYRVSQRPISDGEKKRDGSDSLNSNTGFVLLKHTTETGEGRSITFYSLYMHLRDLDGIRNAVGPLPNNPPETGSSTVLPKWLSYSIDGVQAPRNLKVYRKDILGYAGACHGQPHLHFEIFMTEGDFKAWFEQSGHAVQLGNKSPTTPVSKDYWGHSYFVIPGGQAFASQPPNALGAMAAKFPSLQSGTLDAGSKLFVEAYFHKGQRYTRSWIEKDGTLTPLNAAPVPDTYADYEYKMYERATALYPQCPSDGYELLRFGRILSDHPTLPASAQKTWVAVTFETGKQGYIDISQPAIQKLSDADLPFFMGWQKIEEGNTPFSQDGICDYDELRKIVAVVEDAETPAERMRPAHEQEAKLATYIANHAEVRERFRGFVCHAPSEWDASGNEARYKRLKDPDGFFGKRKEFDPHGYDDFIKFLEQFQFLEKTALGGGKKFWYFHPLAFIRHFRRCGWLGIKEFEQIYSNNRYGRHQQPPPESLRKTYLGPLNLAARKYLLTDSTRFAHFLGQGAVECDWLATMQESSMLGNLDSDGFHGTVKNPLSTIPESTLGHWYGEISAEDDAWFRSKKFNSRGVRIASSYDWRNGNCDREDAQKFRGRGFKQLTGRSNYAAYWVFRGWISLLSFSNSWWRDPEFIAKNRTGMKRVPARIDSPQDISIPENCIDSAGFYLRFERPKVAANMDKDTANAAVTAAEQKKERDISRMVTYAINGGYIDEERRWQYTRAAKKILS